MASTSPHKAAYTTPASAFQTHKRYQKRRIDQAVLVRHTNDFHKGETPTWGDSHLVDQPRYAKDGNVWRDVPLVAGHHVGVTGWVQSDQKLAFEEKCMDVQQEFILRREKSVHKKNNMFNNPLATIDNNRGRSRRPAFTGERRHGARPMTPRNKILRRGLTRLRTCGLLP
ncbi:unnamed protein product [Zymoseptoria tritici ST99CH_3D7]|uniref:Uncharacterized protein n=1 Tax=Zymoseptoria tritici (strain ST99CH_3D7) TaxID=1276538 RepID=A0A1X7RZM5_ZYMT9|nr:unnamed protein product [Zymoseptoria tritici ST99CH_3D7]